MQVFKAFFKIVKTDLPVMIMYLAISIGFSFIFASQGSPADEVFSSKKADVCVVDRAQTDYSKAVCKFFEKTCEIVELEDNIDAYQDALFFMDIDLLAILGEDGSIKLTSAPGSMDGTYANMQLKMFLNTLDAYKSAGTDTAEAADLALKSLDIGTDVSFTTSSSGNGTDKLGFKSFYTFMPYGLLAALIHCIGSIMIVFNKKDLKSRMECSSLSLRSKNFSLVACCITVTMAIWLLYNILIAVVYGSEWFSDPLIGYYILNSLMMALAGLSIGFFVGMISSHEEHISIFVVSLSVGLSFLGGVFVPLSIMGSGVKVISRFTPTYWYITTLDALAPSAVMTSSVREAFMQGTLIQLAFSAAFLGLAFFISKMKVSARTA